MKKIVKTITRTLLSSAMFFSLSFTNFIQINAQGSGSQEISAVYGDYTVTAAGNIPDGLQIEVQDVPSLSDLQTDITNLTQSEYTAVEFAADISFTLDSQSYTSVNGPLIVTIQGPIVRRDTAASLDLYCGDSGNSLQETQTQELSLDKAVFTLDSKSLVVVTSYETSKEEHPVLTNGISDISLSDDDLKAAEDPLDRTELVTSMPDKSTSSSYKDAYLPALRDQGAYGTCWAFAATALVELSAISNAGTNAAALSKTIDLSEAQIANYSNFGDQYGQSWLYTGGSSIYCGLSYLKWIGPVNETDVPYSTIQSVHDNGLASEYQYSKDVYHVQNMYICDMTTDSGRTKAKQLISENGGVQAGYYATNYAPYKYYSTSKNAYYCSDSNQTANHAVTVVGWDDNFAASNFNYSSSIPEGNGAWLIRNSWGGSSVTDECYAGYFWLSYYDKSIDTYGMSLVTENTDNYDQNLYYGKTGNGLLKTYSNYYTDEYAQVYQADCTDNLSLELKAISTNIAFETPGYITSKQETIKVYRNITDIANPESGELAAVKTINTNSASDSGLFTYLFTGSSAKIRDGSKFAVVISENSGSNTNLSAWEEYDNDDYDIKLFLSETASIHINSITVSPSSAALDIGSSAALTVTYDPSDTTDDKTITWTSSNPGVASVSSGTVTALAAGTATITASCNGHSSTSSITVKEAPQATAASSASVQTVQNTAAATQQMYRLYNPNSGEHFYTKDTNERNLLASIGWIYEGIGWTAPVISNTPVYRMYNPNAGDHHYTTNANEKDMLVKAGWIYEGIGWYSDDAKGVPLYRQYNPNAFSCNHNYTRNKSENDWLVSLGWNAEGISWYGCE